MLHPQIDRFLYLTLTGKNNYISVLTRQKTNKVKMMHKLLRTVYSHNKFLNFKRQRKGPLFWTAPVKSCVGQLGTEILGPQINILSSKSEIKASVQLTLS